MFRNRADAGRKLARRTQTAQNRPVRKREVTGAELATRHVLLTRQQGCGPDAFPEPLLSSRAEKKEGNSRTMEWIELLIFLLVWIVVMRWVLPRFGMPT